MPAMMPASLQPGGEAVNHRWANRPGAAGLTGHISSQVWRSNLDIRVKPGKPWTFLSLTSIYIL